MILSFMSYVIVSPSSLLKKDCFHSVWLKVVCSKSIKKTLFAFLLRCGFSLPKHVSSILSKVNAIIPAEYFKFTLFPMTLSL